MSMENETHSLTHRDRHSLRQTLTVRQLSRKQRRNATEAILKWWPSPFPGTVRVRLLISGLINIRLPLVLISQKCWKGHSESYTNHNPDLQTLPQKKTKRWFRLASLITFQSMSKLLCIVHRFENSPAVPRVRLLGVSHITLIIS